MHQGQRLKWLIDNKGISRGELAKKAGVAEASIYNYQNEEHINSKKLELLAKALEVPITFFFDKNADINEPPLLSNAGEEIEKMDIPDKDKIYLLRNKIDLLQREIEFLKATHKKVVDAKNEKIDELQAKLQKQKAR